LPNGHPLCGHSLGFDSACAGRSRSGLTDPVLSLTLWAIQDLNFHRVVFKTSSSRSKHGFSEDTIGLK
jgi:hypothetical protein